MIFRKQLLPFFMLSFSTLLLFGAQPESATITNDRISVIFDMNGVLCQTGGTTSIIGLRKFAYYFLTHPTLNPKKKLKEKLFALLSAAQKRESNEVNAPDDNGNIIPQIMCSWMKGTRTPQQLRNAIDIQLAQRPHNIENCLLHDIAHMMFTPEKFAQTQHVVPEAVAFVTHLKQQGYKIYILSNFCSKSFNIIKSKNPEFFALFDGIIVSGDVGLIKPDQNIYTHLLNTHGIDKNKACFIDDQEVNIKAAQEVGITGFICPAKLRYLGSTSPDIDAVQKKFSLWREALTVTTQ